MRFRRWTLAVLLSSLSALPIAAETQSGSAIPHLERRGNATQLIVKGKPYLALAGDDTGQGNNVSLRGGRSYEILRVKLYRYR